MPPLSIRGAGRWGLGGGRGHLPEGLRQPAEGFDINAVDAADVQHRGGRRLLGRPPGDVVCGGRGGQHQEKKRRGSRVEMQSKINGGGKDVPFELLGENCEMGGNVFFKNISKIKFGSKCNISQKKHTREGRKCFPHVAIYRNEQQAKFQPEHMNYG